MAEPFLGEIRLMSFQFAPKGWALCNGQLLPINQNQGLFALLGTSFGGNGQVNFALPDYRGRVPIHMGASHTIGESGGETQHTLSIAELPIHGHLVSASTAPATQLTPTGNLLATATGEIYGDVASLVPTHPSSVALAGGSQPHNNMQPYLTLSFCIALQGIFPSQT